jgi:hypothetical protein
MDGVVNVRVMLIALRLFTTRILSELDAPPGL